MYSRYTPNGRGGFDRRQLPDEADLRAAQGRAPPSLPEHREETGFVLEEGPSSLREATPEAAASAFRRSFPPPGRTRFRSPSRRGVQPGEPGRNAYPANRRISGRGDGSASQPPILWELLGQKGLLTQLLPHGLDSEDLLILGVLLLSMKQDGSNLTELLIAGGLYFWL